MVPVRVALSPVAITARGRALCCDDADGRSPRTLSRDARFPDYSGAHGKKSGTAAEAKIERAALGLEGHIGKRADSLYESGRSKSWIKLKCRLEQDFVIAGYTEPGGSRTASTKSGLTTLTKRLAAMKRDDTPLADAPLDHKAEEEPEEKPAGRTRGGEEGRVRGHARSDAGALARTVPSEKSTAVMTP